MEKKNVGFIFVILVYRNVEDILELLESIKAQVLDSKVIIVNNYYDETTQKQFEKIAAEHQCDFINCENRGYGAGNNAGIRFALEKYEFEYLIISNPDIVIKNFPVEEIRQYPEGVYGCEIDNLAHKNQNPMLAKNCRFASKMLYKGIKEKLSFCLLAGKAINKLQRDWSRFLLNRKKKENRKVYQIHGSFLIFSGSVIQEIEAPYDEEMFLFAEEGYLAYLLNKKGISSYYCPEIKVLHKEDGSMKFRNDIDEECVKSNLYFFEKYYFNNEEKN